MSFDNPTAIKVGLTGAFSGISYRVLGRSVLGVIDEGRSYYWNEFNVQADTGQTAILVYDTSDRIAEWRWFTTFEPQSPITAAEAASKCLGDLINLDGTDVRVTLRDHSQVYHVEGEPPEGEALGTQAEYFNAESGEDMVVVSWTGDEVDCYHGKTISAMAVAHAFNIAPSVLSEFKLAGMASSGSSSFPVGAIFGLLIFIIVGLVFLAPIFSSPSRRPAIARIAASPATLTVSSSGKLNGKKYTIVSDALVEIKEVGLVFQRHEFHLRDEDGNGALLIHSWKPGANDWCLLNLTEPSEPMTPQQAAAVEAGKTVNVGSIPTTVTELFCFTTIEVKTSDILQSKTGQVLYAFDGQSGPLLFHARWNDSVITFYTGSILHEDPTSAFAK